MIRRRASRRPAGYQCWPIWLLVAWSGAAGLAAEAPSAVKRDDHPIFSAAVPPSASSPVVSPQPTRPVASGVSPRVKRLIESSLPPFTPAAATADSETPPDVVKLPPVFVKAPKLKVPDELQTLSSQEFAALLRKRYPGASVPGQDPNRIEHGMPNYARLQYEEDQRHAQHASLENFADLLEHTGDHAGGQRLKKEIQRAFGGTYKDPLVEAMDKSANGGRR